MKEEDHGDESNEEEFEEKSTEKWRPANRVRFAPDTNLEPLSPAKIAEKKAKNAQHKEDREQAILDYNTRGLNRIFKWTINRMTNKLNIN